MVAEVNAGHTYVNWGDFPRVKRLDTGLLGAELKADEKAGRYLISKIYAGENWNEATRSPLTEQGIGVQVGDYLIALNGSEVTLDDNPYRFLENTAGRKISIKVNARPVAQAAREYWIKPVKSELNLFYLDWVRSRREMVDRLSAGRIGYIHVPDTADEGNRELYKGMYAYKNKEALIIDERYNGGGFIPVVMTELLARKTLNLLGDTRSGTHSRSRRGPQRPKGDADQRLFVIGRRRLALLFQKKQARPAHRHAHLGRLDRPFRQSRPGRWRLDQCADLRFCGHRRQLGGGR